MSKFRDPKPCLKKPDCSASGSAKPLTDYTDQRRPRFFYGWVIVAVSALAEATAFGAGNVSFGVFLKSMSEDLQWSRTSITGALTVQSLAHLFVSPILGPLVDLYGPRVIMSWGAIVAGASYVAMGHVSEIWQFYLFFALGTVLGLHEIGSLVTTTVVSKWFVRMRGRALGFTGMGHNLGAVIFGPLVAFIIGAVGWRTGWSMLGLIIVAAILPPAILLMRRTPEDLGLRPDGGASARLPSTARWQRPHEEPAWKVMDALRSPTAWLLVVALNLANLGVLSMNIHQVAYFTDVGFSLQAASLLFALQHSLAVISKLFWGFLAERISVRFCLMGTFVGRLTGFLILLFGTAAERVYLFTIISGLFGGAITSLQSQIWADYYGRAFLGSIRGVLAPFSLISSLGGPLFAAFVFDVAGSYDGAFWVFAITLLLGVVLLYFAKPPGLPIRWGR